MAMQGFGRETRKGQEVANEVRLIRIAMREGQPGPVRRRALARGRQGALEAPDASKQLGRHAHLGSEDLNQSAMAQADARGDLAHARARLREPLDSDGYGTVALASAVQPRAERPFQ